MNDLPDAIHFIFGGLLFLLCWIVLKPTMIFFGVLSVGLNGIANGIAIALEWLESKLL